MRPPLLASGAHDTTEQDLQRRRESEAEAFDDSATSASGYRFTFRQTRSAERHITSYVQRRGLPRGATMSKLKADLAAAAAIAVKAGTLGKKGYNQTVAIRGQFGTWNLIIEQKSAFGYEVVHADLDGIY